MFKFNVCPQEKFKVLEMKKLTEKDDQLQTLNNIDMKGGLIKNANFHFDIYQYWNYLLLFSMP